MEPLENKISYKGYKEKMNNIWHSFKGIFIRLLRNRNLRFDILTSFFVLQVLTATSIMYYTYSRSSNTIVDFSLNMIEETSDSKIESITHHLKTIQSDVQMGSYIIRDMSDITINNKILLDYCIAVVKHNPFLESIFIATETGMFFQVKRLEPGSTYRSSPSKLLPKRAAYAVRVLDRSVGAGKEVWNYLDNDADILESEELPQFQVTYDPRVRDWYQRAMQTRSGAWSDIYIFSTTKQPGIAAAYPLHGGKGREFGVIGADLPLEGFQEILRDIHFNGLAMVITANGEVVATPFNEVTAMVVGNETQLLNINELTKKTPSVAFRKYITTGEKKLNFSYEGKDYVSVVKGFGDFLFKDWLIMVVMPEDQLIGPIKTTQQQTMAISICILIFSILLISYIAHRIASPIVLLAKQANNITQFDLSSPQEVRSSILEIQLLQSSISAMRRSLVSFGKFVPRSLVRKLIDKGGEVKVGGRSRKLTIFFSDIAGFTTVSEAYSADKLMLHLSEYLEELTNIIIKENGTIDKYIGDGIMAFWGAPQTDRDHALNACRAALQCQKRLADLNRHWNFEKKPVLETRIGIHTGDVIVGNMGSSERLNYTILGDSVNLAARLEGVNKVFNTKIIISEDTLHLVRDVAVVRPLDVVTVKGKDIPVKIYELIALTHSDPLLVPTDEQIEFADQFAKAFTHYQEQRWEQAIAGFEELIHTFGRDGPAEMYIKRCRAFQETPPGASWDGVFHLEEK